MKKYMILIIAIIFITLIVSPVYAAASAFLRSGGLRVIGDIYCQTNSGCIAQATKECLPLLNNASEDGNPEWFDCLEKAELVPPLITSPSPRPTPTPTPRPTATPNPTPSSTLIPLRTPPPSPAQGEPVKMTACSQDTDCPAGYYCQIQASTQRYCPDNQPDCNVLIGVCSPRTTKDKPIPSTSTLRPTPTPTPRASITPRPSASSTPKASGTGTKPTGTKPPGPPKTKPAPTPTPRPTTKTCIPQVTSVEIGNEPTGYSAKINLQQFPYSCSATAGSTCSVTALVRLTCGTPNPYRITLSFTYTGQTPSGGGGGGGGEQTCQALGAANNMSGSDYCATRVYGNPDYDCANPYQVVGQTTADNLGCYNEKLANPGVGGGGGSGAQTCQEKGGSNYCAGKYGNQYYDCGQPNQMIGQTTADDEGCYNENLVNPPPSYTYPSPYTYPTPADPDSDGDGIRDGIDQCDYQAEDYDGNQDYDGCPEAEYPSPYTYPTPAVSCNDDIQYCDGASLIWKHGGYWNGSQCIYAFDYIGEC